MSLMFRQLLGALPTVLVVEPANALIDEGDTLQLSAIVLDQNGNELPDVSIDWASDDTDVATVDSAGLVTGEGGGSCTITATSGPLSDTCELIVNAVDPHFANVIFLLDGTQPGFLP